MSATWSRSASPSTSDSLTPARVAPIRSRPHQDRAQTLTVTPPEHALSCNSSFTILPLLRNVEDDHPVDAVARVDVLKERLAVITEVDRGRRVHHLELLPGRVEPVLVRVGE